MDKNYISTGADEKTGMLMDAVAIIRDTAVRSPRPHPLKVSAHPLRTDTIIINTLLKYAMNLLVC